MNDPDATLLKDLRSALESSWDSQTSYRGISKAGSPAYGQCYPTARVVQYYLPQTEILQGSVWTGASEETHFWNGMKVDSDWQHIDLTRDQFPAGSFIQKFSVLERRDIVDSESTQKRFALLLQRVRVLLSAQ